MKDEAKLLDQMIRRCDARPRARYTPPPSTPQDVTQGVSYRQIMSSPHPMKLAKQKKNVNRAR